MLREVLGTMEMGGNRVTLYLKCGHMNVYHLHPAMAHTWGILNITHAIVGWRPTVSCYDCMNMKGVIRG
jgi:hypothetical protein